MKSLSIDSIQVDDDSNEKNKRVVFTVTTENGTHELWYEVEPEFAQYVCDDRADCAIVPILPVALMHGYEVIESAVPLSSELFYNLKYQIVPQLLRVKGCKSSSLLLDVGLNPVTFDGKGVGAGMSGGIDSFATLAEYSRTSQLEDHRITHFTYYNVGAHHGFDIRMGKSSLSTRELYEGQLAKMKEFCRVEGYDLIVVDSNLSDFLRTAIGRSPFYRSHTFRNAGATMLLQKLFGKYYYSSAFNLDGFAVSLEGDTAAYEKWLLPNLNTGSLAFYNSNQSWNRLEKTQVVSGLEESWDNLMVCFIGVDNCGQCDKCRKTLMALDVLGEDVLERYRGSFDLERYRKNERLEWFGNIYRLMKRGGLYGQDMRDIFSYGLRTGFPHIPEPPLEDAPEEPAIGRTNAKKLAMRLLPSKEAKLLCWIPRDRPFYCMGSYGDWTKVRNSKREGFVRTKYLTMIEPHDFVPPRSFLVNQATPLRELPTRYSDPLTDLAPQERVTVLRLFRTWYEVETLDGYRGFVRGKLLDEVRHRGPLALLSKARKG